MYDRKDFKVCLAVLRANLQIIHKGAKNIRAFSCVNIAAVVACLVLAGGFAR
jgi:hypothetical protein